MNKTLRSLLLAGTAVATIGLSGQALAVTITVNGANTNVASDPAATPGITFLTDHRATVSDGVDITTTGTITTATAGTGAITLLGTTTVAGAVGSGNALREILAGATGKVATFSSTVAATTIYVGGTGTVAFSDDVTGALVYSANGTVTFADGKGLTGAVTAGATNTGTLTFLGDGSVSGSVGASGATLQTINAGITGKTVSFAGDVSATTINLTGTGILDFNGNVAGIVDMNNNAGTVTIASGKALTGSIQSTGGTAGTVTFEGGTQSVSGGISGITLLNVSTGTTLSVGGTIKATTIDFAGGTGVLSVGAGGDVTGAVDSTGGSGGTLTLAGGTQAVTGVVGGTNALTLVNAGATGGTTTFNNTINATDLRITGAGSVILNDSVTANVTYTDGAGTITLADNKNITGTVDGGGILTLSGTSTISAAVGGTTGLSVVNAGAVGAVVNFGGALKASTVNITGTGTVNTAGSVTGDVVFGGNGTLALADAANLTGAVTTKTTNTGTLTFAGDSTVSGSVGASGAVLNSISGGAAGKMVSFGGDVFATTINLTNTGTLDFNGNVAGILDMNNNNGTVTIASGKSLSGTVQSTGGTNGTLTLEGGTQSVSGAVAGLSVLNAGQAGGTTSFGGTVAANTVNVGTGSVSFADDVTGAVTFTGDGAVSLAAGKGITGNITGTGGSIGSLTLAGGATLGASVGTAGNTLKTLTLSGTGNTVTAGANSLAADTTNIGGNTLAVTGTFGAAAGQTLNFALTGATTSGQVTATGIATISADTNVFVNADAGGYVANAQSFTLVDAAGGGAVGTLNPGKLTYSSAVLTFAQTADPDDLIITATRTSLATAATTPNAVAVGTVLEAIGAGGTAAINTVQGKVQAAATTAELNAILESAAPTVDGSHVVTSLENAAEVQSLTDKRTAFRSKNGTGVSAGAPMFQSGNAWYQLYGHFAQQDLRDGIAGYDSNTMGLAVGADTDRLARNTVLGVALNYGSTSVDSKNLNTTETSIDSFGLTGYGRYDPVGSHYYYTGQLGFALNQVDQSRHNVGGAGLTANADYKTLQYTGRAAVARDFYTRTGLTLTPSVWSAWSLLTQSSYTETGTAATLNVSDVEDFAVFDLGIGIKAKWDIKNTGGGRFRPYVRLGYSYDLVGDRIETTSAFTGGGATFKTTGADPTRGTVDAGFGVALTTRHRWTVSADYDLRYKSDYTGHSGMLRVSRRFY